MTNKMFCNKRLQRVSAVVLAMLMVISSVVPFVTTESYAKSFKGNKGDSYNIWTDKNSPFITYGSGEGGYSTGIKTDLNGADDMGTRYSYCVQPHKGSPLQPLQGEYTGTGTIDKIITDEAQKDKWVALRNLCFYAPSYPGYDENVGNIKGASWYNGNFTHDWGVAHFAMSYIYAGCPSDIPTWAGTKASDLGQIWTDAKKFGEAMKSTDGKRAEGVPAAFEVFVCFQKGIQDMIVGMLEKGTLKLVKSSENPGISENLPNCYSLKGAVYEVFDENNKLVATLVTNEKGETETIELAAGDYTIKEKTPAKGFALDSKNITVKVEAGEDNVKKVSDVPENDPFVIVLNKYDKETDKPYELGGASLEGAVFEINFYDAIYSNLNEVNKKDLKKVWKLKTDKNGRIKIPRTEEEMKTYFVSGDEFYKDLAGKNTFPIGSYTVKEVTPPAGYLLNEETHLAVVKPDKTSKTEAIKTYNMLNNEKAKIIEQVERGDLEFVKKDIAEERLANCVFKITSEGNGESHIIVTDPNGKFTSKSPLNDANANDAAYDKETGKIDESKLNFRNRVWFGSNKKGDKAPVTDKLRPFPYDTYVIQELPCKANEGRSLITTKAVVYEDGYVCELGTITDADIGTTIIK